MDRLFDLTQDSDSSSDEPAADQKLVMKYLALHKKKIANINALINPPNPDEFLFLFTDRSFNAFTFIPYLIEQHGSIQELTLSTFSISKRILGAFARFLETGAIGSANLVIADSLKHQRPDVVQSLVHLSERHSSLSFTLSWNHSKILVAKAGAGNYVIEGSGNWSENARHEQYLFANSKSLLDFRLDCLANVERR